MSAAAVDAVAALIVAMTPERLMGRNGGLPWRLPEDLAHFKARTLGGACVMGRLSFRSLGRPLPGRANLVVSRAATTPGEERDGARWFPSLSAACRWVPSPQPDGAPPPPLWILGGAAIFAEILAPLDGGPGAHARAGLPVPRTLVVTWVPSQPLLAGDLLFPFDQRWIETHYRVADERAGLTAGLRFVTYALRR